MKNKKPDIRFKGFSEEWEEKKLGEVAEIIGGGTPSTSIPEYWGGEIDWYSPTEIGLNVYAEGSVKKITEMGLQKSSAKILPPNKTILFTSRAGIGDMAILKYSGATNQGFQSFVINDNTDVYFVYSIGHLIKKFALTNASGSTFLEISGKVLGKMEFHVPNKIEQTQIGNFFKNLDNLINLHQRKYEKLGILKKAMLEKMFPKNGADVPEIRFKGFSEAWEERKLGEIVQIKDSARVPKELWVESGIRYLRSSDLENNGQGGELFISIEAYENYKSKTGVPERGDVLFNSGGDIGFSILKTDDSPVYVQGGAILYARTSQSKDIDGGYLNVYFSTPQMKKYIDIASAGGTIKHFTLKPANAAPIIFPKKEEQEKIGNYFKNLDNLLTLHQRELEKLQHLKKALLEKMFV